uniref:Phosphoserine phosphatase 1 n=1 Tax=Anthurium amnicola TaxID=1678845 RepID=A0A1D1YVD4_9ARAE
MKGQQVLPTLVTTTPTKVGRRPPPKPSLANNAHPCLRIPHRPARRIPAPAASGPPPSPAAVETVPWPSPALRPPLGHHRSSRRRRRILLVYLASPLVLPAVPLPARARGLFRMPPVRLANRYFLVRAGESEYEREGVVNTNPVAKTSVDSGLSEQGKRQAVRSARELERMGACDGTCWIWPSITQRSYQAAEIIAALNGVDRSRIVPEYSFLDARGLGAYEGRSLDSVSEVYSSDTISPNIKPPPIDDGTPNESVADVFVRVTQLMSIVETQYSGDTVIIVSPDSDNLSILQAGLVGLDLRRHRDLFFNPGEVRFVDPKSIPVYKQPPSAVYKCTNPPSCT